MPDLDREALDAARKVLDIEPLTDLEATAFAEAIAAYIEQAGLVPRVVAEYERVDREWADTAKQLREALLKLLRLILDDMATATNADLACDGPVPRGDSSAEVAVWRRIEAEAKRLRAGFGNQQRRK